MDERETTIIINPAIPLQDITPLERLFLSTVFDAGEIDGALLLYSDRPSAVPSTFRLRVCSRPIRHHATCRTAISIALSPVAGVTRSMDPTGSKSIWQRHHGSSFCRISLPGPRPSRRFGFSNGIAIPRRLLTASVPMSC